MTEIPLKPINEQFTDEQWQAIFDQGDNLLVSASAGSGKTTVLVRRVIEKLKSGSNIDELLIVTFTEAAAREMKERIQDALQLAINQETDETKRQHFTRQLVLLPTASISTIHAFCLTVIRRFYYLIDLDPVFRMMTDETETILMKEDVWDELRENFYAQNREEFFRLTANFSNDRSDEGLTDLVFSLYEFARANPAPTKWLSDLPKHYQATDDLTDSSLYMDYLHPVVLANLYQIVQIYEEASEIATKEAGLIKFDTLISTELEMSKQLLEAFSEQNIAAGYQLLETVKFDRFPTTKEEELKEYAQEIKQLRTQGKEAILDLHKIFLYPPKEMLAILEKSRPLVEEMARVTQAFMDAFSQRKREKGVLDFNDLEHLTLAILTQQGEDTWLSTEASTYYRSKFKEVMVDEYQDVNQLQEAILYWVRQPDPSQGNMFMVGDVKQSIYSFRLADPGLFIEKYNAFATGDGGRRIVLSDNFRSRSEVLDFTNLIFEQLMDPDVGQIEYDEAAKLVTGFTAFPEDSAFSPEILIYEKGEKKKQEDALLSEEATFEDKSEGELFMTGLKIRELVDSKFMIYDKKQKENRPIEYQDIVLLTPTKKNNLTILDVFKTLDIPLEVNDAQNYFQATEIRTMIALLQIIDNPYQDIPLVSILRSPLARLNEVELATIRLADRTHTFYEACLAYTEQEDNELSERLLRFEAQLNRWRELARRTSLADLLWDIYDKTAYLDYVVGLPAGRQRQANLYALVDRAKSYEQSSFRGLYQFVRFIEKMQQKNKDLAEPTLASEENAVRVMTIHASKGLEFPIVFLLDMTKGFNLQDITGKYVFEEKVGAGIQYMDPDTRVIYKTLAFQAITQVRKVKLLSEEMRKLYVGLTRAEQKLFIVGSYASKEATIKKWLGGAQTSKELVLNAATRLKGHRESLMDWIGYSLIRHPKMEEYLEEGFLHSPLRNGYDSDFAITWMSAQTVNEQRNALQIVPVPITTKEVATHEAQQTERTLNQRLEFVYPYQHAEKTTSYQSVSEIKRLFEDPDDSQASKLTWENDQKLAINQPFRYTQEQLAQPKFLQEKSTPSAAAIGTATHYLLQLLPLTQQPTQEELRKLLAELVDKRLIDQQVAKKIDLSTILWFFETDLGKSILENQESVKREQPFSTLISAEKVFKDYPTEDDLLIHGIADGFIDLSEGITLYDFKTDHIIDPTNESELEKVVDKYIGQLRLYKISLESALGKEVVHVKLVLLSAKKIVDITRKI